MALGTLTVYPGIASAARWFNSYDRRCRDESDDDNKKPTVKGLFDDPPKWMIAQGTQK